MTAEEPPKSEPANANVPRSDVDGNGAVDAHDVAWAIYFFNRSESGIAPIEAQGKKLDLNGDQLFDATDVLLAVTDLNAKSAAVGGEGTSATTTDSESEEDLDSLTFLLAEDLVASRKKSSQLAWEFSAESRAEILYTGRFANLLRCVTPL